MKKYLLLFIVLFLAIPLSVNSAVSEVKGTAIGGASDIKEGETVWLTFKINFSNPNNVWDKEIGVYAYLFEIVFDENVFIPTNIESDLFDSIIYNADGQYYLLGEISSQGGTGCTSVYTYCGDITTKVGFYVKNTTTTKSTIKMKDVDVIFVRDYDPDEEDPADEDVFEVSYTKEVSHSINIKKATGTVSEPKSIVGTKSTNADLKELTIENYDISFDKTKKNYTIYIEENINELNVNAITDNDKATYQIIGAEDLKANNYEVKVIVKAESGKEVTYVIKAKIKTIKEQTEKDNSFNIQELLKNNKKYLYIGGFSIGGIILLLFIYKIIRKFKDRKIDKMLDDL